MHHYRRVLAGNCAEYPQRAEGRLQSYGQCRDRSPIGSIDLGPFSRMEPWWRVASTVSIQDIRRAAQLPAVRTLAVRADAARRQLEALQPACAPAGVGGSAGREPLSCARTVVRMGVIIHATSVFPLYDGGAHLQLRGSIARYGPGESARTDSAWCRCRLRRRRLPSWWPAPRAGINSCSWR